MRISKWITVLAVGSLLCAPALTAQSQDKAEVALRAAIEKETVEGNLKVAIEEYKKLAQNATKSVAARALVHLGECYEKQGNADARKMYEQVLSRFADQAEAVAVARAHLTGGKPTSILTARLIATDSAGELTPYNVTADGRLGVVDDWTNGNLGIRDMITGQVRILVPGSLDPRSLGPHMAFGRYGTWGAISPDQKQMAFARYGDPENPNQGQFWVVSTAPDAKPRLVLRNPDMRNITPQAWSPDGKSVLVHIAKVDHSWQLAWVSVSDGGLQVLKSFEHIRWPDYWPRLSPDGRYIAYSVHARNGSVDCHIYLLAADASHETVLTQTAGINASPVWTPDGTHVLFVSNRSGAWDLWSVPVRDGRAAGTPSKVRSNIGSVDALDMTRTGTLYYRSTRDEYSVSVADTGGRVVESFVGINPSWSRDGKSVAFTRPRLKGYNEIDTYDLLVRSVESGEEKLFSRPALRDSYEGIRPMPAVWFRDGRSLLTLLNNQDRTNSLSRLGLESGEFNEVLEFNPSELAGGWCALSPDEMTLYVTGHSADGNKPINHIIAVDLSTNDRNRTQVAVLPGKAVIVSAIRLSPDGRTFAFKSQDDKGSHVARIGADGSDYQELVTDDPAALSDVAWSPDGRSILFGLRQDRGHWRIMRIAADGGKAEFAGLTVDGQLQSIDLNPKDARIVFSVKKHITEAWALDNVLSAVK